MKEIKINKKILSYVVLTFFIVLVLIGLYNNYEIKKHPKYLEAFAFDEKGYASKSFSKKWKFIYIYNDKPYYFIDKDENYDFGSIVNIVINKNKPSRHNFVSFQGKKTLETVILHGSNFGNNLILKVFEDGTLKHKKVINNSFGFKTDLKKEIQVQLFDNNKLIGLWCFKFKLPQMKKFYPIELTPKSLYKRNEIMFDSLGRFQKVIKEI